MGEFIESNINIFYWTTIALLSIASIIIIFFALIHMMKNKKAAKKTLLTFGGLATVLLISYYGLSNNEVLSSYQKYNVDANTSKLVGMGIWSFYILSIGAITSIIFSELSKKFLK